MAAAQYYNPSNDIHLKPMHLAPSTISIPSIYSSTSNNALTTTTSLSSSTYHLIHPHNPTPQHEQQQQQNPLETPLPTTKKDLQLKSHIRLLKLLSRILGTILSLATLIPLLQTIAKFLATKDTFYTLPNGTRRTAWAHDSITWYTYMYASVSGVSFLLNLVVLVAYTRGIRSANKASSVAGYWTWGILALHVVVWSVSAGIYRYGREPDQEGKFRDLWGWTCSAGAKELQAVLTSVDFDEYCGVQSSSFYIGLTNIGTGLLSCLILGLAVVRRREKKRVKTMYQPDLEPLRQQ